MKKKWILVVIGVINLYALVGQGKGGAWIVRAMQEKEALVRDRVDSKLQAFNDKLKNLGYPSDSVKSILTAAKQSLEKDGKVILADSLIDWIPYLAPFATPPVALQETKVAVPFMGPAMVLPFKVAVGDTLVIHIHTLRPWKVRQVQVREGDVFRQVMYGVGRKNPGSMSVSAEASGNMTVHIAGRRIGLPVAAKVGVQQLKRVVEISWDLRRDTVYRTESKTRMVSDTLEEMVADQVFSLTPALDITSAPGITYQLQFPEVEGSLIGWAYWTGVGAGALRAWEALDQARKSPRSVLADFALGQNTRLPEWKNEAIQMGFFSRGGAEAFSRGRMVPPVALHKIKGSTGYAFVSDKLSKRASDPLYLAVRNYSDLYDYTMYFKASIFYTVPREVTVEVPVKEIKQTVEVRYKE